jgi:hypothetical protein
LLALLRWQPTGLLAVLLYAHRGGDANMQSVWICSRNDVLGNLAVLLAALGVFGTGTGWPDLIVAAIMASLALQGAKIVIRQAGHEFQSSSSYVRRPAHRLLLRFAKCSRGSTVLVLPHSPFESDTRCQRAANIPRMSASNFP